MLLRIMLIFWVILVTHNALATNNVIIVDGSGSDTLECCACADGKCPCPCSNLSLALTHIKDNTEIRITSNLFLPLRYNIEFGNVSSIVITGHNNPSILCYLHSGLIGNNIKQISIQNLTWNNCNGITITGFTDAFIVNCTFLYFTRTLTLHGFGSIHINQTSFSHFNGGIDALAPSVVAYNSSFYYTYEHDALLINTTTLSVHVSILDCKFIENYDYSINLIRNKRIPNLLISSCSFTNNYNSSVVGDNADITIHNVKFDNNVIVGTNGDLTGDGAAIRVYNSTVNVSGPVMFRNNKVGNDGGAVYLSYSNITLTDSVVFYNNTASDGGAVYIGRESNFNATKAELEVINNTASMYGGGFYVDVSSDEEINSIFYQFIVKFL